MSIPYRTRRTLRRLCIAVLVLMIVAALGGLCWLLWLNRYIVYTKDGAVLDFNQSLQYPDGVVPQEPEPGETVVVLDKEEVAGENVHKELVRFSGYYVVLSEIRENFDAVKQQLDALPNGSTILLDIKSVQSYFYYSTAVGLQATNFDATQMDELITELKSKGHYLIARIPAFQEYQYILEDERTRVPYSLLKLNKNGSWMDKSNPKEPCYWMNPVSDGTLTYLIQIITEIRSLGFHEVVLNDFRFPDSDQYIFEGEKMQALTDTASTLVKTCATDVFAVSFTRSAADLTLPEGRTRLYITGAAAADAATIAGKTGFTDASIHVVFLTDLNDTRFDEFCVLRPLSSAH